MKILIVKMILMYRVIILKWKRVIFPQQKMWRIRKIKKRTAELALKMLTIKIVMEEDGSEQETKLITEMQVKVTVPTQKYQSTHWKVSMRRPLLRW